VGRDQLAGGSPLVPSAPRRARPIDVAIIALTIVMAAVTIWTASTPIAHVFDFLILGILWLPIGAVWALSLIVSSRPNLALIGVVAIVLLLLAAGSFVQGMGPLSTLVMTGVIASGAAVVVADVVRKRLMPLVVLIAPAIVLVTVGLILSGIPKAVRFAVAEPALRAYAMDLFEQPRVELPDEAVPVSVGGFTVDWSVARGGCAHLVTTYVGILGEYPAGIAYCPSGPPGDDSGVGDYEAFSGTWYRWFSHSEFPFD
jgi:hypothetical protein